MRRTGCRRHQFHESCSCEFFLSQGHVFYAILIIVCIESLHKVPEEPGPRFRRLITHSMMKRQRKLITRLGKYSQTKLPLHRQMFLATYQLCGKRIPCDTGEAFPIIRRIHGAAESPPAPLSTTYPETDSPGCTGTKSQKCEVSARRMGMNRIRRVAVLGISAAMCIVLGSST